MCTKLSKDIYIYIYKREREGEKERESICNAVWEGNDTASVTKLPDYI